jgi:RND family efflux transporter MFP subunit
MKKLPFLALLLVGGAALLLTGIWYGRHNATASSTGEPARKILYWVDPMNPAHTSDRPGLAPCGMQMEPVYEDSAMRAGVSTTPGAVVLGTVRISQEKQQLIGIRLGAVEMTSPSQSVRLFGRVAADARRIYRLNAGVDGIIREVSDVAIGSHVKKDQWLATFSAPDARTPLQGLITAVSVLAREEAISHARAAQSSDVSEEESSDAPAEESNRPASRATEILGENVRLATDRLQTFGLSLMQIEEIKRTRIVPAALRIHAPADGVIIAQNVTPGVTFEKGEEWYQIADLERVWVLADVPAQEVEYFKPGVAAQVSLPGERKSLAAHVSDTLPQFDPATRTFKVRFEVDNPEIVLRPEMFVDVILPVSMPQTLTVSADAILDSGRSAAVFVARGDGVFEPRVVETGRRFGDQVEILKGLELGEKIVLSGNFLLDSESQMKLAAAAHMPVSASKEVALADTAAKAGSSHKDPVCGMMVEETVAKAVNRQVSHEGQTYHFCSDFCKQQFAKEPTKFLKKEATHLISTTASEPAFKGNGAASHDKSHR